MYLFTWMFRSTQIKHCLTMNSLIWQNQNALRNECACFALYTQAVSIAHAHCDCNDQSAKTFAIWRLSRNVLVLMVEPLAELYWLILLAYVSMSMSLRLVAVIRSKRDLRLARWFVVQFVLRNNGKTYDFLQNKIGKSSANTPVMTKNMPIQPVECIVWRKAVSCEWVDISNSQKKGLMDEMWRLAKWIDCAQK